MIENKQTLAVAESVTAGCLQTAFSLSEGATGYFQGGITAYNLGQKCRHLNIDPIHVLSCNCVSEKASQQMAINVSKSFISDWGIGVTGYAAPMPEKHIKELFVCHAFTYKGDVIKSCIIKTTEQSVEKVQQFYTNWILKDLLKVAQTLDIGI